MLTSAQDIVYVHGKLKLPIYMYLDLNPVQGTSVFSLKLADCYECLAVSIIIHV